MPIISNFQTLTGIAPVYLWSEVGLVADNIVVLKYNKSLSPDSVPVPGDYAVAGTVQTISSVVIYGPYVYLTMSDNLLGTDTLTVSYTKGTNPIQDSSENESINLTTESVVNNIKPPAFSSAEIGKYNNITLVVLLDKYLNESSVPATTAWTVNDGASNPVIRSWLKNQKVYLELTNIVTSEKTVTVAYTQPASNRLKDLVGHETLTFGAQSVTNNIP